MNKNTRSNQEEYRRKRIVAFRICRNKKREFLKKRIDKLQNDFNEKRVKDLYHGIKIETGFQARSKPVETKGGKLLTMRSRY